MLLYDCVMTARIVMLRLTILTKYWQLVLRHVSIQSASTMHTLQHSAIVRERILSTLVLARLWLYISLSAESNTALK